MKFVIVGGSGYIGFHIGKDLHSKGHEVILADVSNPDPEFGPCEILVKKTNILDPGTLEEAFNGADCVIHCGKIGEYSLLSFNIPA